MSFQKYNDDIVNHLSQYEGVSLEMCIKFFEIVDILLERNPGACIWYDERIIDRSREIGVVSFKNLVQMEIMEDCHIYKVKLRDFRSILEDIGFLSKLKSEDRSNDVLSGYVSRYTLENGTYINFCFAEDDDISY